MMRTHGSYARTRCRRQGCRAACAAAITAPTCGGDALPNPCKPLRQPPRYVGPGAGADGPGAFGHVGEEAVGAGNGVQRLESERCTVQPQWCPVRSHELQPTTLLGPPSSWLRGRIPVAVGVQTFGVVQVVVVWPPTPTPSRPAGPWPHGDEAHLEVSLALPRPLQAPPCRRILVVLLLARHVALAVACVGLQDKASARSSIVT